MGSNNTTLETYQNKFDNYVAGTPQEVSGTQKEWLDELLARIDTDTPILEVGSAFGRDAAYVRDAGYENLTVTDAFDAAVETLKERGFSDAQKLNLLTDEPEGEYGLIFASAVFLHFTAPEFETVLRKLHRHLGAKGLLSFTVKEGDGEMYSDDKMDAPRFFHYWRAKPLREVVESCGYEVLEIGNRDDSQKWLAVTCRPNDL